MSKLRILLDECLDRRLTSEIKGHFVWTVQDKSWAGLKNGELLSKAQKEFDVFITSDQNLSFQQNLPRYDIAVLVLCPVSSQLEDMRAIFSKVQKFLLDLKPGQAVFIRP